MKHYYQVQAQACLAHNYCSDDWYNVSTKREALKKAREIAREHPEVEVTVIWCKGNDLEDFSPDYLSDVARFENGKCVEEKMSYTYKRWW